MGRFVRAFAGLCLLAVMPAAVAHAADLGLTFYTGDMFPAKYKGAIFSTQHGSWNRTVPIGARLMVTFLKEDGHVAGPSIPFAEGWNENGHYLGRPVDVAGEWDGFGFSPQSAAPAGQIAQLLT